MKNIVAACLLLLFFNCCNKKETANNYINNDRLAAYTVDGLKDCVLSTDKKDCFMPVTIRYTDSAQRKIRLSVTGLPAGITVGDDFITSGYPTFSTNLHLFDTGFLAPAITGDYTAVLNVQSDNGASQQFPFKISIATPTPCTAGYVGAYYFCADEGGGPAYSDTIYADSSIVNKVWFANLGNKGKIVMAMMSNCYIFIPAQVVDGIVFYGSGQLRSSTSYVDLRVKIGNEFRAITMRR